MKEQENLTGKGITAAVLDTGIFPHMDFDGRIVAFRDLVYGGRRLTMTMDTERMSVVPWRKWKSVRRKIPGCGTGMPVCRSEDSGPKGKWKKAGYPRGD